MQVAARLPNRPSQLSPRGTLATQPSPILAACPGRALALRLAARRCALEPQPSPHVRDSRRLRVAGSAAQKGFYSYYP